MIINYELLKKVYKEDKENVDHDETDCSRSVFDNMVNEAGLKSFVREKHNVGEDKYRFRSDEEDGGFTAIFADNESGNPVEINTNDEEKLRLVVATGDVTIKNNVNFYGIIMAKGKITMKSGAKLIAAPLDAARIFQAQSTADGISPKDLFWDGDKYVLGNTTTTDDNSGTETKRNTTYDLAECITYENWKKK